MDRMGPEAGLTAALETRMSRAPYVSSAKRTSALSCAGSPTWQAVPATARPSPRSAATVASTLACLRELTTTRAPCGVRWRGVGSREGECSWATSRMRWARMHQPGAVTAAPCDRGVTSAYHQRLPRRPGAARCPARCPRWTPSRWPPCPPAACVVWKWRGAQSPQPPGGGQAAGGGGGGGGAAAVTALPGCLGPPLAAPTFSPDTGDERCRSPGAHLHGSAMAFVGLHWLCADGPRV